MENFTFTLIRQGEPLTEEFIKSIIDKTNINEGLLRSKLFDLFCYNKMVIALSKATAEEIKYFLQQTENIINLC